MQTSTQVPAVLQAAFQKSVEKRTQKDRKDSGYSPEERRILGKYKEEYKLKTTTDERDSLFTNHILVDIFGHWFHKGEISESISDEDVANRVKDLSRWIKNNWRSQHHVNKPPTGRKKSRVDVVWRDLEDRVRKEISAILLIEDGKTGVATAAETFRYRTAAARNVYEMLTEDEKAAVQEKIAKGGVDTNPPDIQRRRAMKLAAATVAKTAEKLWKDMGVLSLTFFAYTRMDGKFVVEMDDNMAKHKGSNERRFIDLYDSQVCDLQRKMFDYLKLLYKPTVMAKRIDRPDLVIRTESGFPLMPDSMDDIDQKKLELEDLLRRYLNAQYKLASGQRKSHVPFGSLRDNPDDFIDDRYVPQDFIWKDPRNMTKATILSLIVHIRMRQERYGAENAFRFRQYHNGSDMVSAEYETQVETERAADRAKKQKATRRKLKKGKEKATAAHSPKSPDPAGVPPPDETSNPRRAAHDNNDMIDPALLPNPQDNPEIIVNDIQLQVLLAHGYPPAIPINGPNDGPPQYRYPASALEVLNDRPRPRPTGRIRNEETQNNVGPQVTSTPDVRPTQDSPMEQPDKHRPITGPNRRNHHGRKDNIQPPAMSTRSRVHDQQDDNPTIAHPRRSDRNRTGKDIKRQGAKKSGGKRSTGDGRK